MTTRLKVVGSTEQSRSPERQALVEAKASYDAAVEEERELEDALASVRETCRRAKNTFNKACEDGKQAKTAQALRAAREAHQAYQDEIDAAQNRENEIKERREGLAPTLRLRQMKLEHAVAKAVSTDPATIALFREFEEARARFIQVYHAVGQLSGEAMPQDEWQRFFAGPGMSGRYKVFQLLGDSDGLPSPLAAQWKGAVAKLANDPDAELPGA